MDNEKMRLAVEQSRLFRERLLADPYRPGYHFAVPGDNGMPGDPNGAFYANGRYHLMYLYNCCSDGCRWGHMSSVDLVHWRHHPDALIPDALDGGIFSGGALVDGDRVWLCYWGLPAAGNRGGIRVAYSDDRENHYERWTKAPDYAVACTADGLAEVGEEIRCAADPSNIWKQGGRYYMQAGNLLVLNRFRDREDAPEKYRGDWTELYSTDDPLRPDWTFEHRFYNRDPSGRWTDRGEDDMCPSFLPLPASKDGGEPSGKYLQLFIAHNRGAQYYIGSYDPAALTFSPEKHGRMSWRDNTFFAPEALMTPDGRQIMWSWLLDDMKGEHERFGWSGVFGLPRQLWLDGRGELGMAPVGELAALEYNLRSGESALSACDRRSCRISLRARVAPGGRAGLRIFSSEDAGRYAEIVFDSAEGCLVFDESKAEKINFVNFGRDKAEGERAPFVLAPGELLELTCYIDGPVADIFANDRQAITRRVCAENPETRRGLSLVAENAEIISVETADMMPCNMF